MSYRGRRPYRARASQQQHECDDVCNDFLLMRDEMKLKGACACLTWSKERNADAHGKDFIVLSYL